MELSRITEIEKELRRFQEKLKDCKNRIVKDGYKDGSGSLYIYQSKETGALKRAALDLKQTLTKYL